MSPTWTQKEIIDAIDSLAEGESIVGRGSTGQHYVARLNGRLVTFWEGWHGSSDQTPEPISAGSAYQKLQAIQSEHPGAYLEMLGKADLWWLNQKA